MSLKLVSAGICPFAHRTRLVLSEKKLQSGKDYEHVEIDLANKPDWLLSVSPYGKVPAIQHGEARIYESSIINEYLDEVYAEPKLFPDNPIDRATARIWIDFANTKFIQTFYGLFRARSLPVESAERTAATKAFNDTLEFFEEHGLKKFSGNGPYFFGEQFSLVDISLYPWFERLPVLEELAGWTFPSNLPLVKKWAEAVRDRQSVKDNAAPSETYVNGYRNYMLKPSK